MPPDSAVLLELDLQLDAAHVAALILDGRPGDVDAYLEATDYQARLERYRRQRESRATLPQPPDTS